MKEYDVLVIGAGAAGMMAAGTAASLGASVCLLEKNGRPGRKLMITGKGRCNVTNDCPVEDFIASVPTNGRFLYSAASRFAPRDVIGFFEGLGVRLKTERGNRVFPESDQASEIVDALVRFAGQKGTPLLTGTAERLLLEDGAVKGVALKGGETIRAGRVIVACGGASYPGTGSTGDGYQLARQAGHKLTPLRPSLVPLTVDGGECAEMMGLSLKNVAVSVRDLEKKKDIFQDFGEMLFTHFGVSGPVILSASAHLRDMKPGKYRLFIDLKPALTPEKLDARLVRELEENQGRDFGNAQGGLLPRKLIPVAVRRSGIPPQTRCGSVTREQRHAYGALLKGFELDITGFRPIEEAIVTSGGVDVKEINPKTMESRLVRGLYFAGEVLDVDAYTGGFNLQIAFCTGRLAGAG